jgi:nucleoside-diphosphate-sugar epimerase
VLVAGATGFIGANLVRELVLRGASVHALVRPGSSLSRLDDLAGDIAVHAMDAADPTAVRECLARVRPRAVVNLARRRHEGPESRLDALVRDNVVVAANLIAAAGGVGCSHFVHFGSPTEYEPCRGPLDESTPVRPVNVFGATKAAATLVCREVAAEAGVSLMVLRPFQVYGPWDLPRHLVPTAITAALDGNELRLAPGGRRDWVFVADVVDACLLALAADPGAEELNLGSGRQWSNEEVVATIAELTGREIRVQIDERASRPWDRDDWMADASRARALLGWAPRYDLRGGLQATLSWELERRGRGQATPAAGQMRLRASASSYRSSETQGPFAGCMGDSFAPSARIANPAS